VNILFRRGLYPAIALPARRDATSHDEPGTE
jgi:hypothetical protein